MAKLSTTQKFLEKHPMCCFCGGGRNATTIEHAPPKCLFINKQRWKGLEFPACARCNNGSSQQDQVVSFFALAQGSYVEENEAQNNYAKKLGLGINNNHKKPWPLVKSLDNSTGAMIIHDKSYPHYLDPWAAKMGFALWYEHMGDLLTKKARVIVDWIPNGDTKGREYSIEMARKLTGRNTLQQGKNSQEKQFAYKYAFTEKNECAVFIIILHNSFMVNVIVFADKFDGDLYSNTFSDTKCPTYKTTTSNGISRSKNDRSPYER